MSMRNVRIKVGDSWERNRHQDGYASDAWKKVYEDVFSKYGWAAMRALDSTR